VVCIAPHVLTGQRGANCSRNSVHMSERAMVCVCGHGVWRAGPAMSFVCHSAMSFLARLKVCLSWAFARKRRWLKGAPRRGFWATRGVVLGHSGPTLCFLLTMQGNRDETFCGDRICLCAGTHLTHLNLSTFAQAYHAALSQRNQTALIQQVLTFFPLFHSPVLGRRG
jgi:hypothetical protein